MDDVLWEIRAHRVRDERLELLVAQGVNLEEEKWLPADFVRSKSVHADRKVSAYLSRPENKVGIVRHSLSRHDRIFLF